MLNKSNVDIKKKELAWGQTTNSAFMHNLPAYNFIL